MLCFAGLKRNVLRPERRLCEGGNVNREGDITASASPGQLCSGFFFPESAVFVRWFSALFLFQYIPTHDSGVSRGGQT